MAPMSGLPSEVIEVPSAAVRLRRRLGHDRQAIRQAMVVSADELRPWLPGIDESIANTPDDDPTTFDAWQRGREFVFVIETTAGDVVGELRLMNKVGPRGTVLGYWVRTDYAGRGIATACAEAAADTAFALGSEWVEAHCDEANLASAAVLRKAGFTLERTVPHSIDAPGQTGRSQIWTRRRP
jgi:RimJ/RimL family protein N-acetyltransferase